MKNIMIIISALLLGGALHAQTYQPSHVKMNYLGQNVYLDQQNDFKQSNFMFQWHWYASKTLSEKLSINGIHLSTEEPAFPFGPPRYINPDFYSIASNTKMTMGTRWFANKDGGYFIAGNMAFQYEPTYKVNLNNPSNYFVPRQKASI